MNDIILKNNWVGLINASTGSPFRTWCYTSTVMPRRVSSFVPLEMLDPKKNRRTWETSFVV